MNLETTKNDTREAILDAAEQRLTRYGYGKMTMSELAKEAGIGVGTTYLHFPGKAEVALAVIMRVNARIVENQRIIAASDAPVENRLRDVLTQRVLMRFERVRHQTHTLEELRTAIMRHQEMMAQLQHWRGLETQIVVDLLTEGKTDSIFQFEDVAETADAMLGATEAFLPRNLRPEDLEPPEKVPERVNRIVRLMLRAILSKK